MKSITGVQLENVQQVYSGPEGQLWKLIMGEQIHIGGLTSSMDLAERAGIKAGSSGVDLCCCIGAGMRFLVRFRQVGHMTGVDATAHVVEVGRNLCRQEGMAGQTDFVVANVLNSGLDDDSADFVWGEDAWCYVSDKARLISEAARIVKPGGTIAFTDWVEGPTALSAAEAQRFLAFMKFPTFASIADYSALLRRSGCEVLTAEDTGRFAPCVDLYLSMLTQQLTYDALKIIGFDREMMQALGSELQFAQKLAHDKKIIQGMFIARKQA